MRKQKGFSLIELLIVVAIILIIAAIAIPNLLRARMAANESSAVASVRTMNTAEVSFLSAYPTTGYSSTLLALGPTTATACTTPNSTSACLIDWNLAHAISAGTAKSGYMFNIAGVGGAPATGYVASGVATTWNQTGVRSFCSVEDSVIRGKTEAAQAAVAAYNTNAACAGAAAFVPLQ